MDYLYENLGDERFQEFCSCLVSKEFPNVQAFPVGQPDGGRDSIAYLMNTPKKEFIVFQVKFIRNANQHKDIHKWLTETIEGEIEKINKLIPKGAQRYYLMTNVRSTGHPDVGSKDKLNKILEDKVKIPSICWWREDINMLFEKDPIFKWSFMEILNGQDILNSILFNNINENRERRESVIRAYLTDQYEMDNEVKFRQINLQNGLYNLFTDVPIRVKNVTEKNKEMRRIYETFGNIRKNEMLLVEENYIFEERGGIGAAAFLLHPQVQDKINQILLEGGPGQGKSTISQYVSQVHRSRLLNKTSDIALLPNNIKNTPVRLPFKIDLRHIASWIENKNPYIGILSDEYFQNIWQKSLESFLVGHIYFHSKLEGFTTSDFISVCKLSPILFVFDGFDEIANLRVREEVIEFINKGLNRISVNSISIQVIITSRPAAFSDSIGFSENSYPHFELTDITPTIIDEYVEKWIRASKLNSKEASEIKRLVKEKLELPHLRDLAKTPMQLAIFISLLRTDGESLPNKRTALYDSYIRLFFNRESEKNLIIRDYRDLIIEIHEYLAWILHSEAELYKNSGTIHIEDLKRRLNKYLQKEGHQTDITDKLFQVVKERVCALVSRVQGTFEFEVQPLREYFCAKYLYKTKPYSPVGSEKLGTLPERFDAISHNFYWQNVVRFFAGCFDKGELSMLIQKLRELVDDDILKYTNYPRIITSQLLSDYVFSQYPLLLKDVIRIIIDGINIGNIINQKEISSHNENIVLPIECGRTELINECFKQLSTFPASDYAYELIGLIKNNPDKIVEKWNAFLPSIEQENLTTWLEYAYRLEIIHQIDDKILVDIINKADYVQTVKRLQIIINGNRIDLIEKFPEFKNVVFINILNNRINLLPRNKICNSLGFLTLSTIPILLSRMLKSSDTNTSLLRFLLEFFRFSPARSIEGINLEFIINDSIDESIATFSKSIRSVLDTDLSVWRNSIEPWDVLVESGRSLFNDCWCFFVISVFSAGIKSVVQKYEEFYNLSDSAISLCKRARCARMKSGNAKYWEEQFKDRNNLQFKLLVFLTWATPKTIMQLNKILLPIIDSLKKDELLQLADGMEYTCYGSIFNKSQQAYLIKEIGEISLSDTFKFLLSKRFYVESKGKFICDDIDDSSEVMEGINELKLEYLVKKYLSNTSDETILSEIKKVYSKIKISEKKHFYYFLHQSIDNVKIPYEIAKKIMTNCREYPKSISILAEKACRVNAFEHIKPVGQIAKIEKWFE